MRGEKDRLPVVYVIMKNGNARYGQQLKHSSNNKTSLTRINQEILDVLINSRVQRRTFASLIGVLSVFIPGGIIILSYALDDRVSASSLIPFIGIGIFGVLLAVGINWIEIKARTTSIHYKLDGASTRKFHPLHSALKDVINSDGLWGVNSTIETSDWKRQAGASSLVKRRPVSKTKPDFLKTDYQVLGVTHNKDAKLFFFPDRLYVYLKGKYLLMDYNECTVSAAPTRFIEDGTVPRDARQVDTTWRYVRKDGGPDRRFNNNRQLPIMEYCLMRFRLNSDVSLEFQVSNVAAGLKFADAFSDYGQV